jgi:hypothetical protein
MSAPSALPTARPVKPGRQTCVAVGATHIPAARESRGNGPKGRMEVN